MDKQDLYEYLKDMLKINIRLNYGSELSVILSIWDNHSQKYEEVSSAWLDITDFNKE